MAKLSARGRTETYRVVKEYSVNPDEDVTVRKRTVVLMSDGTVLEKVTVRFSYPGADPKGRLHDWGYKIKGKAGLTPAEWLAKYLAAGFSQD